MAIQDETRSPPEHVVSDTNTPVYDMVRFWGRKPHNIVNEYVRHYTEEGDIVFDPFAGSGVVALEALRSGRRPVYNDLNPLFRFIARTSARYVDPAELADGFDGVMEGLSSRTHPLRDGTTTVHRTVDWLYATACRRCGKGSASILETEATRVYAPAEGAPTTGITGDGTLDDLARAIRRHLAESGATSHGDLLDRIDLDRFGNARKSEFTRAINARLLDGGYVRVERDTPTSITYACRACDATETVPLTDHDRAKIEEISRLEPEYYYPDDELTYPDGQRFYTYRPGTERVDTLFTARNRIALSVLRHEIYELEQRGYSDGVVDALLLAFVAILEHVSRMQRPNRKGWAAKNYVVHPENLEVNVVHAFRNRFDSVLAGVREANADLNGGRPLGDRARFVAGDARDTPLADGEVDYVFTDPEYGDAVQYFELSYMAARWLDAETNWADEIVVNPRQEKPRDRYERMLAEAFEEVFRVLAPGTHLTVTFHSREITYWRSLLYAIRRAGFEYVDAVYQVPRREYTNWINRRKPGTMSGDVYITFYRPLEPDLPSLDSGAIRAAREAIVAEARDAIMAHDGEASFDQLVRAATLRLIEENVMHAEPVRDFDYECIFDEHFHRVGGKKVWTLADWEDVDDIDYVPLRRRIRWLVEAVFAERDGGTAPLDEILARVFTTLNDARTPDNEEILDVLRRVARPVESDGKSDGKPDDKSDGKTGGKSDGKTGETAGSNALWKLRDRSRTGRLDDRSLDGNRDAIDPEEARRRRALDHDRIVRAVAELGTGEFGYDVWIGGLETPTRETLGGVQTLSEIPGEFAGLVRERLETVDVIWFDGTTPVCLLEVGPTTDPPPDFGPLGTADDAVDVDPVVVSVRPDAVWVSGKERWQHPAVERMAANGDFFSIRYSTLVAFTEEGLGHDSGSLSAFLDRCTRVDASE